MHTLANPAGIGGPAVLLGNTLIFTPDPPLLFNQTYVVEISTALKDVQGVALASEQLGL